MIFKKILGVPALIPAQFSYKFVDFQAKKPKLMKIDEKTGF